MLPSGCRSLSSPFFCTQTALESMSNLSLLFPLTFLHTLERSQSRSSSSQAYGCCIPDSYMSMPHYTYSCLLYAAVARADLMQLIASSGVRAFTCTVNRVALPSLDTFRLLYAHAHRCFVTTSIVIASPSCLLAFTLVARRSPREKLQAVPSFSQPWSEIFISC